MMFTSVAEALLLRYKRVKNNILVRTRKMFHMVCFTLIDIGILLR